MEMKKVAKVEEIQLAGIEVDGVTVAGVVRRLRFRDDQGRVVSIERAESYVDGITVLVSVSVPEAVVDPPPSESAPGPEARDVEARESLLKVFTDHLSPV